MQELSMEEMATLEGGKPHRGPSISVNDVNVSLVYADQLALAFGKHASASNEIEVTQTA